METSHVLDTDERCAGTIRTLSLEPVNRMRGANVLYQLEKLHDAAAQPVDDEDRWLFRARLQQYERRKLRRDGLIHEGSQSCNGWCGVNRHRRQLSSTCLGDFIKHFDG